MKNYRRYYSLLSKYLRPHGVQLVLLIALFFVSIGLSLVSPQILRFFIDAAGKGEHLSILLQSAGLFLGIVLVKQVFDLGISYTSQNLGWCATNAMRADLAEHCLRLDMSFHKARRPGEIIERVDGDVTELFNFFSNLLVELASHIVLTLGILVLLYKENAVIGAVMTVFIVSAVLMMRSINSFAVPRFAALREFTADFYGYIGEILGSTEDIRSNGAQEKIIWHYRRLLRRWFPIRFKSTMAMRTMWSTTVAIFAVGNALAFGIGGVLWSKGLITVGTVYLIFHYTEMLSNPLTQLQRQLANLQKASASMDRIEELFGVKSKLTEGNGFMLADGPVSVEAQEISFQYEDGDMVLKNINLKLRPGKVLGILGRTGSGKTTLARLVARFYDITQGELKLNGQRIEEIPMDDLRKKIAVVTQEVQLFNASIRDNLTFFDSNVTDAEIWAALKEIGLEEWISTLPKGLDTMLHSDGGGLSAGEAQLLAFCRVFLKKPGLIILDEASSRLDPLTEQLMEGAIDKLFKGRTGIIIAHRLQTIERADDILILEDGKVIEHGSRKELAQNGESHLFELLQKGIKEVLV